MGFAMEAQPTYWQYLMTSRRPVSNGDGVVRLGSNFTFNTGVSLLDLQRLRRGTAYVAGLALIHAPPRDFSQEGGLVQPDLGEQSVWNALNQLDPALFYEIPIAWNTQLCDVWWKHGRIKHVKYEYVQALAAHGFLRSRPSLTHFTCFAKPLVDANASAFDGILHDPKVCGDRSKHQALEGELSGTGESSLPVANRHRREYCELLKSLAPAIKASLVRSEKQCRGPFVPATTPSLAPAGPARGADMSSLNAARFERFSAKVAQLPASQRPSGCWIWHTARPTQQHKSWECNTKAAFEELHWQKHCSSTTPHAVVPFTNGVRCSAYCGVRRKSITSFCGVSGGSVGMCLYRNVAACSPMKGAWTWRFASRV